MKQVDESTILELWVRDMSFKDIGVVLGVSQQTIGRRLRKYGINTNTKRNDQMGSNNPRWQGGTSRAHINRTTKRVCLEHNIPLDQCQNCGRTFDHNLDRHHKDDDRTNNDINNIKVLCVKCHNSGWFGAEHTKERDNLGRFLCSSEERGM